MVMGAQIAVVHMIAAGLVVWLLDIKSRHFLLVAPDAILWISALSYLFISLAGVYFFLQLRERKCRDPDEEFNPRASFV